MYFFVEIHSCLIFFFAPDKNEDKLRNEVAEFTRPEIDVKNVLKPISSSPDNSRQGKVVDWKGREEIRQFAHLGYTGENKILKLFPFFDVATKKIIIT